MTTDKLDNILHALLLLDEQDDQITNSAEPLDIKTTTHRINILNSKISILRSLSVDTALTIVNPPTQLQPPALPHTPFFNHIKTLRTISNLLPTLADPLTPPSQLALILVLNERLTMLENAIAATLNDADDQRDDTTAPTPTEDTKQP